MNKDTFLSLIKGITITMLVAGTISYFLSHFLAPFVPTFLVLVLFQFVFFYFYGEYRKRKFLKIQMETQVKYDEMQSAQSTTVTCPCDRNLQTTIPIKFNEENTYNCQGCNKQIKVSIETRTALATNPVIINPLDSPLFVEQVERLLKKDGDRN